MNYQHTKITKFSTVYECDDEMIEEVSYDYPVWELDEIKNEDEFDSYSDEEKKEMIDWYNSREAT